MPIQFSRLALLALLAAAPLSAQQQKEPKPPVPAVGLATAGLAGQTVAGLPPTMPAAAPPHHGPVGTRRSPAGPAGGARAGLLRGADSRLANAGQARAAEVKWLL